MEKNGMEEDKWCAECGRSFETCPHMPTLKPRSSRTDPRAEGKRLTAERLTVGKLESELALIRRLAGTLSCERLDGHIAAIEAELGEWRVLADGRLDDARKAIAKYNAVEAENARLREALGKAEHARDYFKYWLEAPEGGAVGTFECPICGVATPHRHDDALKGTTFESVRTESQAVGVDELKRMRTMATKVREHMALLRATRGSAYALDLEEHCIEALADTMLVVCDHIEAFDRRLQSLEGVG